MIDLRQVYEHEGSGNGKNVTTYWKIGQFIHVSNDKQLGFNQFTCHLTVEKWDVQEQEKSKRIAKFHLSFKE